METSTERTLHARAAAYRSWAHTRDRAARTASARAARDERFRREVDPDGTLTEADRETRARAARRAYFTRLALASVRARQRRKATP